MKLALDGVRADPLCNPFTFRVLLRMACQARNSLVTFGGVTPLEMAVGRRPADVIMPTCCRGAEPWAMSGPLKHVGK